MTNSRDLANLGGGFIQAGGGVQRTVESKLKDVVSVKDFGAKGDGTTDDTAAFAAALATDREVYVPIGTYIVNNLAIPDGAVLTGELSTVQNARPQLVTNINGAAIFTRSGSPSYIKISKIGAQPASGVTGASFFRMTNPGVEMGQYCEFDDVITYRGFTVSYDGYFIFGQWKNCFDGYQGALENAYHAFIRSAPTNQNAGGIGQTNICLVRDCKIYQAAGTVPNRSGATHTNGAASVILAYGSLWQFVNTDFEAFTNSAAVIARGVKAVTFENCWYEGINHSSIVGLENLPLTAGQVTTYPVSFRNCNFNLTAVTSGGNLVQIQTDTTPIPDGDMEWYTPRVVFDSCNFGSIISGGGKISNISKQVVIQNCRQDGNNSNDFPAFLDQGTHVALKDKDGNLLNDARVDSLVKIRRVSLAAYGDSTIGGWQCEDTDNNKIISRMLTTGYNSGANGEITWFTNVSSTLTPFVTATNTGRYFRFDSTTGGIQFNGDTAAANALDDYEEGNFSPTIEVAGGTVITGSEVGRYVKIGKLVQYSFSFVAGLSNAPAAATVFVKLPFAAVSLSQNAIGSGVLQSMNNLAVGATVVQNTDTAELRDLNTNALITNSSLGINSSNLKTFRGTIVYRTAA